MFIDIISNIFIVMLIIFIVMLTVMCVVSFCILVWLLIKEIKSL